MQLFKLTTQDPIHLSLNQIVLEKKIKKIVEIFKSHIGKKK